MRVLSRTSNEIKVECTTCVFRGLRFPIDPTERSERQDDQILEIRRSGYECRNYNVLVTFGGLRVHHRETRKKTLRILVGNHNSAARYVEPATVAVDYILRWFMAKVEGRRVEAIVRGPRIHLNVGIGDGDFRYTACGDMYERRVTSTLRRKVTCGRCRNTLKYRRLNR